MKSRQGTSNPKFVRRISQSPWDHSRTTCTVQGSTQPQVGTAVEFKLNSQNKYFTINQQKSPIKCVRTSTERVNVSLDSVNTCKKNDSRREDGYRVQQFKVSIDSKNAKNTQEIDEIYLPIQSVSTVESVPTARKKPAQNQQFALQTKRKQQLEWTTKDIKKILEQNELLLRRESMKTAEVARLNQELETLKIHNFQIQAELEKLIEIVEVLESKLRTNRTANEDLRKNLQHSQSKKNKLDVRVNELSLLLAKLEFDSKCHKQEKQQLNRVLKLKQIEINELKSQSTNKQYGDRYPVQTARVVRSVSIQQCNNFSEQAKVYTIKAENPVPNQKYNRFVQTQNCKLEVALKQNEMLVAGLKSKDKTIKSMQREIQNLNKKVKVLDQTTAKLNESQKLIEDLNQQILVTTASKIATKYRYF